MMENNIDLISFTIGILGSLVASYIFPGFRRAIDSGLSFLFNLINQNQFNLSGTWQGEYTEPSKGDPTKRVKEIEKVKINQIGNIIWATGETQNYKRKFKYKLSVIHDMIMGAYRKSGTKGATSGTGVIQLVVNADRNKLTGNATWMDTDSNALETDKILWHKIS